MRRILPALAPTRRQIGNSVRHAELNDVRDHKLGLVQTFPKEGLNKFAIVCEYDVRMATGEMVA